MRTIDLFAFLASFALLGGCERGKEGTPPVEDKPVTPMQQGNNQADLDTTKNIRQALVADDTLSQSAKNTVIVTSNGVITLRGVVKDAAEKAAVAAHAAKHAAGNRIDNQLTFSEPQLPVR